MHMVGTHRVHRTASHSAAHAGAHRMAQNQNRDLNAQSVHGRRTRGTSAAAPSMRVVRIGSRRRSQGAQHRLAQCRARRRVPRGTRPKHFLNAQSDRGSYTRVVTASWSRIPVVHNAFVQSQSSTMRSSSPGMFSSHLTISRWPFFAAAIATWDITRSKSVSRSKQSWSTTRSRSALVASH